MTRAKVVGGLLMLALAASACGGSEMIPNVVGQQLDEAKSLLDRDGIEVETEGGGAFGVVVDSGWEVCSQEPEAGEKAGKITVFVERDCDGDGDGEEGEGEEATSTGLTATPALAACTQRGEAEFPYGFDGHNVLGVLAEEVVEDRWFLKFEATVTNEFNAEREVNVECFVGGTNDAPVVEKFNAY